MKTHFINLEGIDYCGKSTQLDKIEAYLQGKRVPIHRTREPGGTALGGALREIIKRPETTYALLNVAQKDHDDFQPLPANQVRSSEAELLLFMASRADFFHHVVRSNLEQGVSVLADRGPDSSTAYQGGGEFHADSGKLGAIAALNRFTVGNNWPVRTFLFTIDYATMLERKHKILRGNQSDAFEGRGLEFYERVISQYAAIAERDPERVIVIDGNRSIEDIFDNAVKPVLDELYEF